MSDMDSLHSLVAVFNEQFDRYGLALTPEDVALGSGDIENGDDCLPLVLSYRFGKDADGEFLDYYFSLSYHQGYPDHIRMRKGQRDEKLPIESPYFTYPADATEEYKARLEEVYCSENRRIFGMLCAKGFEKSHVRDTVPVQVVYVSRRGSDGNWNTTEELVFPWNGNYAAALGAATWLVDDALASLHRHGMTAAELLALYRAGGPDPYIRYEDRSLAQAANPISACYVIYQPIPFNSWGYAETAAHRLCGTPLAEQSRALACWQGRYDRYNRQRMESQLFLDRRVKLTRDICRCRITLPAGREGKIAGHGIHVESARFDYRCEAPVIFVREQLPLWRQVLNAAFGLTERREPLVVAIPYDAMEFAESDAVYAAHLEAVYAEIR